MNFNILLKYIIQYKYAIAFALFAAINFITLNNLPWGDDYPFVFDSYIRTAPSIWVFWDPYSIYFKSWPIAYNVLWAMLQVFEDEVFFFRLLNLSIHAINSFLVYKISHYLLPNTLNKNRFILFVLFLFHPIAINTFNWIFQIKTLLSMFFGLLTIISFYKLNEHYKYAIALLICFFLAINSKISVVLLPLYFLYKRSSVTNKKLFTFIIVPMFSMSAYYGLINIKGIQAVVTEKENINKSVIEYSTDEDQSNETKDTDPNASKKIVTENIKLGDEIESSFSSLTNQIVNPNQYSEKILISLFTFGRYISHTLGANVYSIVYEKNTDSLYPQRILLYAIVSFIFFYMFISKETIDALILCFIFYIPISGFFYVPYMKISYISDHWFYLALPFLLIVLIQKTPYRLLNLILFIIVGQSIYVTTTYKSTLNVIQNSLNTYNNNFSNEYLIKHAIKVEDYQAAYELTDEILKDYSIEKESIVNARLVLNTKHLKNDELWEDARNYTAKAFARGQLERIYPIVYAKKPDTNPVEKKILKHLLTIQEGSYNEIIYQDVQLILTNQKVKSNYQLMLNY